MLIALIAALAWVSPDGPLHRPLRFRDLAARLDLGGIAGFALAMIALLLFGFGLFTGFASGGNQTALYSQAPAERLGTASGLPRTFGYAGSGEKQLCRRTRG